MKRLLVSAVFLGGLVLGSCADVGGADPLDEAGTRDGGTLYLRPDPDESGVRGETGLELRKDL